MEKDWERAIERGDVEWVHSIVSDVASEHAATDPGSEKGVKQRTTAEDSLSPLINSKDQHGQTALMVAAMRGHTQIVRLLVESRAELNHTAKYNLSALMLAVVNNHIEIVHILARAGADQSIRGAGAPGFASLTALELAEKAGREDIAAILRGPEP